MPISILPISPPDIPLLAPLIHDAWQSPYNPQLKHFRPTFPTRAEAIVYGEHRLVQTFQKQDPKLFMLKAVDTETDTILGFAQWYVNDKEDPYGERTVATWYEEGSEEREFAERFINGLWGFIGGRVKGKHMGM